MAKKRLQRIRLKTGKQKNQLKKRADYENNLQCGFNVEEQTSVELCSTRVSQLIIKKLHPIPRKMI